MLWDRAEIVAKRAFNNNKLLPITTEAVMLKQQGIEFIIEVAKTNIDKKLKAKTVNKNPFLPYDDAMFVAEVGEGHVCLINKFPVVQPHLLICSKDFVNQSRLLELQDFSAWIQAMNIDDVLGFYNSDPVAGASQTHRHMQIIKTTIPLESKIVSGELAFKHKFYSFDRLNSERAYFCYLAAIHDLELNPQTMDQQENRECLPYNILLTRHWMLVVPRNKNQIDGIFVNAMNYSGRFLVKSETHLDWLKKNGCINILTECSSQL